MKLSIITPCLNARTTIEKTIQSVISQNVKSLEYMIVDGESTDGTLEIIKKYAQAYSHIINYVSEKDNSMTEALNKGIKISTGEVIGSINADDYYLPGVLKYVVRIFEWEKCNMLLGNTIFLNLQGDQIFKNRPWLAKYPFSWNLFGCYTPECSVFFKKDVFFKVGLFNENLKFTADFEFYLRVLKLGKIYYLDKDISCFLISEHQYSTACHKKMEEEVLQYISYPSLYKVLQRSKLTSLLRIIFGVRVYNSPYSLLKHTAKSINDLIGSKCKSKH